MVSARDATALADLAARLRAFASAANHRLALVLAGGRDWASSAAAAALGPQSVEETVWLTGQEVEGRRLPVSHGNKLLGSEVESLVYDAYDGFDPDSFGAALGALRGGGLLLLLTPDLDEWALYPDPQAGRIAVHPFTPAQVENRFIHRLSRIIRDSTAVLLHREADPVPGSVPGLAGAVCQIPDSAGGCRTPDQLQAVQAIQKTAKGRPRRPLVILSNRGRGKSSALGIAAAGLMTDGHCRVFATAPRRAAVEPLFFHAARLLPEAEIHTNRIFFRDARLEFLPPDDLVRSPRQADLLLVDEAAGIPAPLLEQLLRKHGRVVFSTTVHGYEGTGRGFEVRFRRTLDALTPSWRETWMQTPIRWAPEDPLEALSSSALLLDAAPADEGSVAAASLESCSFKLLDRDALADDETSLSQLFGLLVLAHYQTRPMDLRHLLDGPNIRVYALVHRRQIAATALVALEGGFTSDLATEVFAGRRRTRGHLLPQTLCAHAGIEEAPRLRFARVIRIAVHPGIQRRGLGRSLLNGVAEDIRKLGLDLVGSSFGATADLLEFWGRCGFAPVHMGTKRNAASGAHAAVVLKAISPSGKALQRFCLKRIGERLPQLLAGPLRGLEPEIVAALFRSARTDGWIPDPQEQRELESFAFALRPYEAVLPLLAKLVSRRLGRALQGNIVENAGRDVLVCSVLQHRSWGEVAGLTGLAGKAEISALLRRATAKLLAQSSTSGPSN